MKCNFSKNGIRLLKPAYNLGGFLGLVPAYNFETCALEHCHLNKYRAIAQTVILLIGTVYSQLQLLLTMIGDLDTIDRNNDVILPMIVGAICEFVGLFSIVSMSLGSILFNPQCWTNLNNAFQAVDKSLALKKRSVSNQINAQLVVYHVAFLAYVVGIVLVYVVRLKVDVYVICVRFMTRDLGVYLQFYSCLLAFNIATAFKIRYEELNNLLIHNNGKGKMQKIAKLSVVLTQMVAAFNQVFGWFLAWIVAKTVTSLLVLVTFFLHATNVSSQSYKVIVLCTHVPRAFFAVVCTTMAVMAMDYVKREKEKMKVLCYQLHASFQGDYAESRAWLLVLVQHCESVRFSAAGFFEIDRGTLLGIFATVTTYAIVIIQLYE